MVSSMKKVFLILAAAAMAAASCTKPELEIQKPSEGKGYYFVVNADTESEEETPLQEDASNLADTKITVGNRQETSEGSGAYYYPLYWAQNDKIRIYNEAGTGSVSATVQNVDANDKYTKRQFKSDAALTLSTTPQRLSVVYPADESLVTYINGATNSQDSLLFNIPRTQIQAGNNNSLHLRKYYLAYGTTTVNTSVSQSQTLPINDVTLKKPLSIVKVNLSTTYYQGYHLKGVKLFTSNREISGRMWVALEPAAGTEPTCLKRGISNYYDYRTTDLIHSFSVGADFETPELFNTPKTLYFVAYPRKEDDIVKRHVDLVIYLQKIDSNGEVVETVTLPKRITSVSDDGLGNVKLEAGKLTEITISDVSPKTNSYDWFEPVETRDILDGYAYGPQNTYVVLWYPDDGNTTPASHLQYSISVKGRGDFSMMRLADPTHYDIFTHSNHEADTEKHFIYVDGADYAAGKTYPRAGEDGALHGDNPPRYAIENANGDYRLSFYVNNRRGSAGALTNGSMGCWGQIAVYHESINSVTNEKTYTLLWTYMIWGRRTDAADVGTVIVDGRKIMNRALGTSIPNEIAARAARGFDQDNIALFQWGRKDPFSPQDPKNGSASLFSYAHASTSNNHIMAVRHPGVMYTKASAGSTDDETSDWSNAHNNHLWGAKTGGETAEGGHKTIYDPCPQGWRVCDAAVTRYLRTYPADDKIQEPDLSTTASHLYNADAALNKTYTAQNAKWISRNWNTSKNANGVSNYAKDEYDAVICTPCEVYYAATADKIVDYEIWPYHGVIWGSRVDLENQTWKGCNRSNNQYAGAFYWSNGYISDSNYYRGICAFHNYNSTGTSVSNFASAHLIKTNAMAVRCQKDDSDKVNLMN